MELSKEEKELLTFLIKNPQNSLFRISYILGWKEEKTEAILEKLHEKELVYNINDEYYPDLSLQNVFRWDHVEYLKLVEDEFSTAKQYSDVIEEAFSLKKRKEVYKQKNLKFKRNIGVISGILALVSILFAIIQKNEDWGIVFTCLASGFLFWGVYYYISGSLGRK